MPLALAQTNNEQSVILDWYQIIQVGGISGLVSGGGAVLFEFLIDRNKSKYERKRKAIEDIVGLYSTLIFYLDRMIENPEFNSAVEDPKKIKETITYIDNLLKAKFYLVDASSVSFWLYFRNYWEEIYRWRYIKEKKKLAQEALDNIIDLRNTLVNKYNNTLRSDYKERMDTEIEKIDPEKRQKIILK
jgi:hypothetical protein